MSLLTWLFNRRKWRQQKMAESYTLGRQCAITILQQPPYEENPLEAVAYMRGQSNAATEFFNEGPFLREFDRGVLDVCRETEQDLGAP